MARRAGVEIEGLDRLRVKLNKLASGITRGADEGQEATAELIEDEWKDTVPVDTGEYRDSIDHDDESVFATAMHAPFVEFGTSRQRAQPAGSLSAARGRARMPGEVGRAVKRRLP